MKLLGSALAVMLTTGTPTGYLDQFFGDPDATKHRYIILTGTLTVVMKPAFLGSKPRETTAIYESTCDFRDANVCTFRPDPNIAEIFVELHEGDETPPEFSFATKWWPTMRTPVEIGRVEWADLKGDVEFHDEEMEHGTKTVIVTAQPVQR